MSILAERYVIGSLLMDIDSITKVYDELQPEMFRDQILQRAYFEIRKLYTLGEPVNIVNLSQKLSGSRFDDDTIPIVLRECVDSTVTSVEIYSYAKTLIDDYKAVRLSAIINTIRVSPNGIDNQIGELINDLEELRKNTKKQLKHMKQIVSEQAREHFVDKPDIGIHIGFDRLDDMLVLLEPGDVTVIGARPAVGKSAFSAQIIRHLSEQGKRGVLYNLEMSDRQIYERMLSSNTGIGLKRIRKAKAYLGDEEASVMAANAKIANYDLYLHSGAVKPSDIFNECRNLELDYIIIDYLQLMKSDTWYPNRASEVGGISKAIKGIATGLKVPVILLSQLNRVSESRETKEPSMAELRESGDVEQDASTIILLWNTDADDKSQKAVKIDKNRQGELGKVALRFDGSQMQFYETGEAIAGGGFAQAEEKTPFD